MFTDLFILICALVVVMKGATLATTYAALLAESYRLSKYTVGFIIIAIISILPETFIAVDSAIMGNPSFGLGTLFGSNIADLTLVFAIILLIAGRGLKVESKILKNRRTYPLILFLPLLLGLDGFYSRIEGLALIIIGGIFYYIALRDGVDNKVPVSNGHRFRNVAMLLLGMSLLLVGSNFTVSSASALASHIGVNSILIGMLIVGIGTTIPEMLFALKSTKKRDDSLAIGDILGTVLADATIVVGIVAILSPFAFPRTIIFVTGSFMVVASFLLYYFMYTGRTLSRKEAYGLLVFWIIFIFTEFLINRNL